MLEQEKAQFTQALAGMDLGPKDQAVLLQMLEHAYLLGKTSKE